MNKTAQPKDLTSAHNQVIDKWQANERASAKDAWASLESTIKGMVDWFALVANVLLKVAGLSPEERTTMTGGTFHGKVTGKKETPLRYAGDREYVSQAYCSRSFLIHYLHSANRFAEYKRTNTRAVLKDYVTWLQVMYGESVGDHASLSRNASGTLARFTLVKATAKDKDAGKSYASAVYKDETRDPSGENTPKGVNSAIKEAMGFTMAKARTTAGHYDMGNWKDEAIIEQIRAAVCQLRLNAAADKKDKAAKKDKVTA